MKMGEYKSVSSPLHGEGVGEVELVSNITVKDEFYRKMGKIFGYICYLGSAEVHIPDYHSGVVVEFGKIRRELSAGTHSYNALTEHVEIYKHIIIEENHIGYLTRDGVYVKSYNPGRYFINKMKGEELIIVKAIIIDELSRGIETLNGKFTQILLPGRYYPNPILNIGIKIKEITRIEEGNIGLLTEEGKYIRELRPGIYFENTLINEKIKIIDMQVKTIELASQTILTSDNISIKIQSILVYQVTNAYNFEYVVDCGDKTIREIIKVSTQQVLSENTLSDCLIKKGEFSLQIKSRVIEHTTHFGVNILRVDIRDIYIEDEQIRLSLASMAVSKVSAENKIINAKAEADAAQLMRQTADLLDTNAAMQIRMFEMFSNLSKQQGVKFHVLMDSEMCNLAKNKLSKEIIKNESNN